MKLKVFALILLAGSGFAHLKGQVEEATFGNLEGRHIGPARMSGRISCIDAVVSAPNTLWVGAADGGVWKSINQGVTFKPVFDDHVQSIGTITIDQQRPDTVWVGTGEVWLRNSVSVGNGIYRTVNGGGKWEHKGLESSERIARIIIHPDNPDILFVAVLGAMWGDSEERGVYRSTDGGGSWTRLLFQNLSTGCADLAMDPDDPDILYAAMWDFRRQAHNFRSGGEGSGLFKSTDGGTTWQRLVKDLPDGELGRIAVAISQVAPHTLYALIESERSALYRSFDQGMSWEKMSDQVMMGDRPFYYSLLVPDPVESDRIYKPGTTLWVSSNGGKLFQNPAVTGGSYHSDTHALWINPGDNRMMYLGTDGGVYVSSDRGNSWRFIQNLPVSQYYKVSTDRQQPYNIYGGLQDNGSWVGPSRNVGGIRNGDWKNIGFGDGFSSWADPLDHEITYTQYQGGRMFRTHHRTGESKYIKPFPATGTGDLRFNWNSPTLFGKKSDWLYAGAQYLYRSKDRGDSWERISPDLTTNDPMRQRQEESGGITIDNTTAENSTTIFSICESPLDEQVIWVGTDDGNVQLSTNGGKSWTLMNDRIPGLPPLAFISSIDAGNFSREEAFITVDAHRNGDMKPYLFHTTDMGLTWRSLVTPEVKGYCHVIKQDLVNPDLIFLGTEFGLFISLDRGNNWIRFKNRVPQVGVFDLAIQPDQHDLVLGTHGRGVIIIDDITPLRQLSQKVLDQDFAFLPLRPYHYTSETGMQDFPGDQEFVGPNYTGAPRVAYYLKKRHVFGDMYLEMFDEAGKLIRKIPAGTRKGINLVSIPTRLDPPKVPTSPNALFEAAFGPELVPGKYRIRLTQGAQTHDTMLEIEPDPRHSHSESDRQLRQETQQRAYRMLEELADLNQEILLLRDEAKTALAQAKSKSERKKAEAMYQKYNQLVDEISATQPGEGGITGQVRLREKIAEIYGALGGYYGSPTNLQLRALELYEARIAGIREEVTSDE